MRKNLREEIHRNLREIRVRAFDILPALTQRFREQASHRHPEMVRDEYDRFWDRAWASGEYLRTDGVILKYDRPLADYSALDFKKDVVVASLRRYIEEHGIASVLEIGSGAGMNLIYLAQLLPEVRFVGLEPTSSGVRLGREFAREIPKELRLGDSTGPLSNVEFIQGSILDADAVESLEGERFDLVFTAAVLEQMHNEIETAFAHIFRLATRYFYFFEEWLEANSRLEHYAYLVHHDYFRLSWRYLSERGDLEILDRTIPAIQPGQVQYGVVFGRRATT
ncbi:MAG: class I SAM-dependent methyltransferase [Deltaproteobacteria bacterium]|nr:class I SAM-dependent methyltransferase [bacterium]MCB9488842.1 class I SAM-dependent methyltransferase [Deltaproteobacteria bacterium]